MTYQHLAAVAREGELGARVRELLRHVDAAWAGSEPLPLVAALADALRECDPEMVKQLEEKVARLEREAEQREHEAQERGWQDAFAVARDLVAIELDTNVEANGRECINPDDPVDAALDRLDDELDRAGDAGSDDYVPPDSLRARGAAMRTKLRVSGKTRRPDSKGAASHLRKPDEPKMAGSGKHQKLIAAFLGEVREATRNDVRNHLMRSGGVSVPGSYGALDRAIKAGLLEVLDGDRVALAPAVRMD